jgi:Spy/CpxP family protein refolding chaperone
MKTTRNFALTALLALALPLGAAAQEGTPTRERRAPNEAQRAEMRERIQTRFLDLVTERLELDATQRTRVAAVLDQNSDRRREIAEDGHRLRQEAADLLRSDAPDAARAERILGELTRLREQELQLWRAEQDALAGVLSPTQRLELMAIQARFNERVRDVRHRAPRAPRQGRPADGAPRRDRERAAPQAPSN